MFKNIFLLISVNITSSYQKNLGSIKGCPQLEPANTHTDTDTHTYNTHSILLPYGSHRGITSGNLSTAGSLLSSQEPDSLSNISPADQ